MNKKDKITVMNFSGIYADEKYFKRKNCQWLDCSAIEGTNCYCDEEARKIIEKMISEISASSIHFIDSGNYHYMSKLWMDKILFPFDLVLFDHHTDMTPSLIENMLSCGNWVKEALDTNLYLHNVVMIGISDSLVEDIDSKYADRVFFYTEKSLDHKKPWMRFSTINIPYPVYISIDKDVLSPKTAVTNWDQGRMTMAQLESILLHIFNNEEVIGVDICGESSAAPLLNEKFNKTIAGWLRRHENK